MNLEPIIQSEVCQKERQISCSKAYIRNLEKWYWRIYLQGNNGETERIDLWTGGCEGEIYGKSNMENYITICKIDSQ